MEHRTFTVGLIGVKEVEQAMMDRAVRLSQFRTRVYQLLSKNDKPTDADVLVVDGDPSRAPVGVPVIQIFDRGDEALKHKQGYKVERPLLPNRVLKVLDQVTMEVLNYAPEFDVGGEITGTQTSIFETLKGASGESAPKKPGQVDLRVLVVDDSMLVQKQMELTLAGAGIKAEFASDGQAAIDMQKNNHYDLIFLDVMMPGIDGFQTCKALKRIEPSPHVVMLTSKGSAINKAHGVLVGADAYLTKPATRETLLDTMAKVFDRK